MVVVLIIFQITNAYIPSIYFKGVYDKIQPILADTMLILSGKDNTYNNDTYTFTVQSTLANTDFIVILESMTIAEVFPNYHVKVTGL